MKKISVVEYILRREIYDEKISKFLNEASIYLDKLLDYGTNLLDLGFSKSRGDIDIPIIMLYRRGLSIIDSISILIRYSSVEPCSIFLRSLLEILFYLTFIVDKDSDRKSLSYLYYYFQKEKKEYLKYVKNSPEQKEFFSKLDKDRMLHRNFIKNPVLLDRMAKEKIINLENLLNQKIYREVESEYNRLKKLKKKFYWYTLFNEKIDSIEKLSTEVGMSGFYDTIYRGWSRDLHSQELIKGKLGINETGQTGVHHIRNSYNSPQIISFTLNIGRDLSKNFARFFNEEKKFDTWFRYEIKMYHINLAKVKIN